ncbi:FAD-dependent oxidoreductase [Keratinibaculum paraultunense]|nr:FAD-dependent oxidoreductase [Keratinibaculum paraultunense]
MTPFYPLEKLRKIRGLENARYEDPYSGGIGNSVRYLSIAPRDNTMKVKGIKNLFCAGEKSGLFVGHTEAIVTGSLAGYNSVRYVFNRELLKLPTDLAIGDLIYFVNKKMKTEEGLKDRYTFAGSTYFNRMIDKGLYTTNDQQIRDRVEKLGLLNIYNRI